MKGYLLANELPGFMLEEINANLNATEAVSYTHLGKTLLIGPVIDLEHSLEGTSESWDIRICLLYTSRCV